jgi:hypothetical protein
MARIQIITAVTLDGYLPDPNEELLQWVKTDSQGFPFWHERSTFTLFPGYPMLDLICEKDEKPSNVTAVMICILAIPVRLKKEAW